MRRGGSGDRIKNVSFKVVIEGGGSGDRRKIMNLKVVIEEGGVRGQDLILLSPPFLAYLMAFFQRSVPMEINSISTLISNVRTSPGSTHGDFKVKNKINENNFNICFLDFNYVFLFSATP